MGDPVYGGGTLRIPAILLELNDSDGNKWRIIFDGENAVAVDPVLVWPIVILKHLNPERIKAARRVLAEIEKELSDG